MDGAVLYDLNENSYLMKYQMSTSQAQTICDFLDRKGISYFTNCVVDDLLVIYYDQLISPLHQEVYERRHRSLIAITSRKPSRYTKTWYICIFWIKKKLWKNFTGN